MVTTKAILLEKSEDDIMLEAYRAPHNMVCNTCGKQYVNHPLVENLKYNDEPYLNVICNGDIVKL